jgi:hypothetical protein
MSSANFIIKYHLFKFINLTALNFQFSIVITTFCVQLFNLCYMCYLKYFFRFLINRANHISVMDFDYSNFKFL